MAVFRKQDFETVCAGLAATFESDAGTGNSVGRGDFPYQLGGLSAALWMQRGSGAGSSARYVLRAFQTF